MSQIQKKMLSPLLLGGVAAVGLSIGFLLPDAESTPSAVRESTDVGGAEITSAVGAEPSPKELEIPFALSRFDVQDRNQTVELAADQWGHVWATWESQTEKGERTLFLATSKDHGQTFGDPQRIRSTKILEWDASMRGRPSKRSSRMWPHIRNAAERLFLSWVESDQEDPSRQLLMVAESLDQGQTFSEARQLSSSAAVRPTFVGFNVDDQGRTAATWLDHRNDVQQPFASLPEAEMQDQLVYAGPDETGICPCCNLNIEILADGTTLVAFRNQLNGFRDMWIARRGPGETEFGPPLPVVEPRWEFNGCPHDGPVMAVQGDQLHIVWMDAHTGVQQVYHGRAKIGEWKFDVKPIHATPAVQGHAFITRTGDSLTVVWDESGSAPAHHHGEKAGTEATGGSAIYIATSNDGGASFSAPVLVSSDSDEFCSRPVTLQSGGNRISAWTALSDQGKRILIHTVPTSATENQTRQVVTHGR